MENLTKEKIQELLNQAQVKVDRLDKEIIGVNNQEKKMAELKSKLFVEKVRSEGEVVAYKALLKEPKPEEKKEEVEQKDKL